MEMEEAKIEGPMKQRTVERARTSEDARVFGSAHGSVHESAHGFAHRPVGRLLALWRWVLLVMVLGGVLCAPGSLLAEPELQVLKADMTHVTQKAIEESERKAKILLYFSALKGDDSGDPAEVSAKSIGLKFEREKSEVKAKISSLTLKDFKEGDMTVAVMVVFPNGLIHEGLVGPILSEAFVKKIRSKDEFGAIAYGDNANESVSLRLMAGGAQKHAAAIENVKPENDNQVRPNVYVAIQSAATLLKSSKADLKYLIIITDGQGRTKSDAREDFDEATKAIDTHGLRPFVIMYPPEPKMGSASSAQDAVKELKRNGFFTKPQSKSAFEEDLTRVLNHIYAQHHIIEVVYDLNEEWIDPGKLKIELSVTLEEGKLTRSIDAEWPKLSKSYMWILWLVLILLGVVLLVVIIWRIIVWRRNRPQPEAAVIVMTEDGPQDVFCEVCGKRVPETLYGFSGEFCLEKGKTGCPYYQPPDRGRLMITKGELSGTTFFIKEEITTIGSLVSEDTLVLLREPTVSKKHAAIRVDEGSRYELRDFSSTNGTRVNGEFIQRKFLKDGDRLNFGEVEVEFTLK